MNTLRKLYDIMWALAGIGLVLFSGLQFLSGKWSFEDSVVILLMIIAMGNVISNITKETRS